MLRGEEARIIHVYLLSKSTSGNSIASGEFAHRDENSRQASQI
jgi:hypothetical protein